MVNIFDDLESSLKYEQFEIDSGNIYQKFAKSLAELSLPHISKMKRGLDLGCGTGISTSTLFDYLRNTVYIEGVDKSKPYLDIAILRFNLQEKRNFENIFNKIEKGEYYPSIIKERCNIQDLLSYIKQQQGIYKKFKDKVAFHCKDASDLEGIENVDFVFSNQFIHWPRKKDGGSIENPNLKYEQEVLQSVKNILNKRGFFSFNTSGWDFEFSNPNMNKMHRAKHPFYTSFRKRLSSILRLEYTVADKLTFNYNKIKGIMDENGFKIINYFENLYSMDNNALIESCLIGTIMEVFQKQDINISLEDREKGIIDSLESVLKEYDDPSSLGKILETGAHFIVQKI